MKKAILISMIVFVIIFILFYFISNRLSKQRHTKSLKSLPVVNNNYQSGSNKIQVPPTINKVNKEVMKKVKVITIKDEMVINQLKKKLPYQNDDFSVVYSAFLSKFIISKKTPLAAEKIQAWLKENQLTDIGKNYNIFITTDKTTETFEHESRIKIIQSQENDFKNNLMFMQADLSTEDNEQMINLLKKILTVLLVSPTKSPSTNQQPPNQPTVTPAQTQPAPAPTSPFIPPTGVCFYLTAELYYNQDQDGFESWVKFWSPAGGGDGDIQLQKNGIFAAGWNGWNKNTNNPWVYAPQYTGGLIQAGQSVNYTGLLPACGGRGFSSNTAHLTCETKKSASGPTVAGNGCECKNCSQFQPTVVPAQPTTTPSQPTQAQPTNQPTNPPAGGSTLASIFSEAGGKVGVPAKILEAVMKIEYPSTFDLSSDKISQYSTPGNVIPGCSPNLCSATGPMQMTIGVDDNGNTSCPKCGAGFCPNAWASYGNAINTSGQYSHQPNPCNIKDNVFSSAAKLKNDSGAADSNNWSKEEVDSACTSYYGSCSDEYRYERLGNRTYCEYVWWYYQN